MRILYKNLGNLCTALAITSLLASCGASRYSDGFSYRTNGQGLDMGAGEKSVVASTPAKTGDVTAPANTATTDVNSLATSSQLSSADQKKVADLTEMVKTEYNNQVANRKASGNTQPVTAGELVKNVGQQLSVQGSNDVQTAKKLSSLDKLAKKVDKLTKKQASDGFLGSGTTLLFAVIALAGLVLGIFVTWIGWVIFAVFGAIWLFRKLS